MKGFTKHTVAAALVVGCLVSLAPAQPEASLPTAEQMMGHRLGHFAYLQLTQGEQQHPAMVDQATMLLQLATELSPEDMELWRFLAEAAQLNADRTLELSAWNQYIKLNRDDDVAQWRIMELLAARQQTAEKRIAFYQRLVDSGLSRALRSRAAYHGALLTLEQGQSDASTKLLGRALELDPTHKDAALEALNRQRNRDASAQQVAAALHVLFQADPADSHTRISIAEFLVSHRLYSSATQWYDSANALAEAGGKRLDPIMLVTGWTAAYWGAGQTTEALNLIDRTARAFDVPQSELQNGEQTSPAEDDAAAAPAGAPPSDSPPAGPEQQSQRPEIWPPLPLQLMRLAIYDQINDTQAAEQAYVSLTDSLSSMRKDDGQPNVNILLDAVWVRLLFDRDLAQLPELIRQITQIGAPETELQMIGGWLAMRQGQIDQAAEAMEPLAGTDPRAAMGLAMLVDSPQRQRELLDAAWAMAPREPIGLMAAAQLRAMDDNAVQLTDQQQRIKAVFDSVPQALMRIAEDPLRTVNLQVRLDRYKFNYAEPIELTVRLRNASRMMLSVGPDGVIPSQLVILPTLRPAGAPPSALPPIVVDLHRRFRLEPMRSLTVPVRLDAQQVGLLLDAMPGRSLDIGGNLVLRPRMGPVGNLVPGLMGMAERVPNVQRRRWPPTEQNLEAAVAGLAQGATSHRLKSIAQLMTQLSSADRAADFAARAAEQAATDGAQAPAQRPAQPIDAMRQRVIGALVDRFERMSVVEKTWLVSFMPPPTQADGSFGRLREQVNGQTDPMIQVMALTTQVNEPDNPLLNAALRSDDPMVSRFAQATRTLVELAAEQADQQPEPDQQPGQLPNK